MYPHSRVELDNKWDIIQHMAFLSGLALVMVALRIVSKLIQWRRLATDDHLLLASTVQMMAMNILFVYAIDRGGFGHHIAYVSDEQLVFFKKSYFISGIIMPTCYATAKLSLLSLLHSIFANIAFRKVVRIFAVVIICWWLCTVLLDIFICYPVSTRWSVTDQGSCSHKVARVQYLGTPIPWIVTDFAILIAPLPLLWKSANTRKSRARQVGVLALFGVGIITCCIAIKRYVTTLNIDLDDLTFSLVKPCLWNMIESSVTICCAALPGSTSALRKMLPMDILERAVKWIERRLTKTSPSHSRDEHSHDPEMAHADPNIRTQTDGRAPYSPSTS